MGLVHSRIAAGLMSIKSSETARLASTSSTRRPCVSIEPSVPARRVNTSTIRRPCVSIPARRVNTSSAGIESLPQELLLHVFSYLGPRELCGSVPTVCKHWNALHRDPQLYTTLHFAGDEGSTQAVVKVLRRAPRLRALTLVDRQDTKKILEEVCKRNHHIRVLVLKRVDGSHRINASTMKKLVHNCTALHTLKLHGCYVRGDVFYKNLSLQLPHLRTVHFVHGRKFSSGAVSHLVNSYMDLEELRIYNNYGRLGDYMDIPDAEIIALCERFCATLRSVKLDFGVWSAAAFAALKKCGRLEELGILEAHSMSCEGLLVIGSMASLRHLEITCCAVPEATWIHMFAATALTNLTSLVLCRCNTTNRVAVTIGMHLKNLQVLGMSGRLASHPQAAEGVSSTGVESVIRGCSQLNALELLYMDRSVEDAILLIPKFLPGLHKLFIFQKCHSNWDSVAQVETQMPDLVVEYFNN